MPPRAIVPALDAATAGSRAWQAAQRERTGFGASPELAELGHVLEALLRGRGYKASEARWAAHAAAVPTSFNWQGNPRLAAVLRCSTRTAQRARAKLEADGLIRSYLLSPGDQLEGQRAPVRRHQVVRDVERLQRAARRRLSWLQRGVEEKKTNSPTRRSAAHVPRAPSTYAPGSPPRTAPVVQTPPANTTGKKGGGLFSAPERAPMPAELEHFVATGELPPSPRREAQRGGRAPPRGS